MITKEKNAKTAELDKAYAAAKDKVNKVRPSQQRRAPAACRFHLRNRRLPHLQCRPATALPLPRAFARPPPRCIACR